MNEHSAITSFLCREVPEEKLKSISIEMNGKENCALGKIMINGIKMKDGIESVSLTLKASKNPIVNVRYHRRLIPAEVADSLGLEK